MVWTHLLKEILNGKLHFLCSGNVLFKVAENQFSNEIAQFSLRHNSLLSGIFGRKSVRILPE